MQPFVVNLTLSLVVAGTAHAGAIMHESRKDLPGGKERDSATIYAQDGMMRRDSLDENGHVTNMALFRDGVLWEVNIPKRTYQKIDKDTLSKAGMEAKFAKLPPEQRAMMQRAMEAMSKAPQKPQPEFVVSDTGRTEEVAQHSCRIWELKEGDKLETQVCVISPGSIPGGEDVIAAHKKWAAAVKDSMVTNPMFKGLGFQSRVAEYEKIQGFPILTRRFSGGKPVGEEYLKSSSKETLPPEKFEVPQGFTEASN
jgi:hypothetical protein